VASPQQKTDESPLPLSLVFFIKLYFPSHEGYVIPLSQVFVDLIKRASFGCCIRYNTKKSSLLHASAFSEFLEKARSFSKQVGYR
jgi:hypothetical protein